MCVSSFFLKKGYTLIIHFNDTWKKTTAKMQVKGWCNLFVTINYSLNDIHISAELVKHVKTDAAMHLNIPVSFQSGSWL